MHAPTPRVASPAPAAPTPAGRAEDLRRQLLWVTVAWGAFGSVWMWAISGAAMTHFARQLGMPDPAFGLLAALPFLGTLIQIPTSYFLERYGHRKTLFLITGTLHRLLWSVVAMIPWFLPGVQWAWWPAMMLLLLLSWTLGHASGPAWMNWMSDLIPRRIRGRYFAIRNLVSQPVGLVTTIGIGYALDLVEQAGREGFNDLMLPVTAGILGVAGLMGAMDILCFLRVRDDKPPEPRRQVRFLSLMRQPLKDANFRRYLAFNFIFTLGVGFIGQYIWLYLFDVVKWSNWQANLLLMGVPLVARMLVYRAWGRAIDRAGKKPVLILTGVFTVFGAFGWLLITPDHFWLGYGIILLTTMAWPGMEIASFNFVLDLAGSRSRKNARHVPGREAESAGTAYVAINSIAIAVGGVLSGLIGAGVAELFADLHEPLGFGGIVLTYHGVLFLLSTGLRALSMIWAFRLEEPRAAGTRDVIRYMSENLWSNVRQAAVMPGRAVGHVLRWSYRIER